MWLSGKNATDHNLIPEIRGYVAKARLRRGIELVKLANRIEALRQHMEEDAEDASDDFPANARQAAGETLAAQPHLHNPYSTSNTAAGAAIGSNADSGRGLAALPGDQRKRSMSKLAKSAIFREVVLAKVREMKEQEARKEFEKSATQKAEKST